MLNDRCMSQPHISRSRSIKEIFSVNFRFLPSLSRVLIGCSTFSTNKKASNKCCFIYCGKFLIGDWFMICHSSIWRSVWLFSQQQTLFHAAKVYYKSILRGNAFYSAIVCQYFNVGKKEVKCGPYAEDQKHWSVRCT